MGIFNLLASDPVITFLGQTYNVSLNGIGKLINALISGIGIVGVGIIVFSLILKCIVLPFDVYQRISMRKQNIKMKENKEKLEKLQKQYANDKKMYSQKMMELQKEQGFSMLSSCLPMIISLVIFFVAIGAFNDYSAYANLQNYNLLVKAYNDALTPYCAEILPENIDDNYIVNGNRYILVRDADGTGEDGNRKYIYYTLVYAENYADDEYAYIQSANKNYFVDAEKTYADYAEEIDALVEAGKNEEDSSLSLSRENACRDFWVSAAQDNVVKIYRTDVTDRMSFGWIKNIWVTDAAYKHPVLNYDNFKTDISSKSLSVSGAGKVKFNSISNYTDAYGESSYNIVTAKLSEEKSRPNGYFVLIVLSIGTILLQQFISMRSQKEQTQFSSVDGQAASTQKMTLVIMTLMFAFFAFLYSAAFSIYMVTSNLTSLITTLIINKVVDVVMRRKEEREMQEQYNKRFPGRVYVPQQDREKSAGSGKKLSRDGEKNKDGKNKDGKNK